ncbi:MAG TPA: DUF1573 domain-containing protein [bacterium]|nr:DUF1573 domain-containing protein [bacterium]
MILDRKTDLNSIGSRILLSALILVSLWLTAGCGEKTSQNPPENLSSTDSRNGAEDAVPEGPHPRLELAADRFDFGTVKAGEVLTQQIEFKNSGQRELRIARAMGVGSRISVEYPKDPIPPGGSGELLISYDTRDQDGHQQRRVVIISNDPVNSRQYVSFTADLELALGVQPRRIWFSSISYMTPAEQQFKIAGSLVGNINPQDIHCRAHQQTDAVSFRVIDTRDTIAGGITIEVTLDPSAMAPGQFNIPVDISTGITGHDPLNAVLNGTVSGPLTSEPGRVYFGRYTPGVAVTQRVIIRHVEQIPFVIRNASTGNPLFTITSVPHDSAPEQILDIQFLASETDDPRSRALLTVETDLSPHGTLTIPMFAFRKVDDTP